MKRRQFIQNLSLASGSLSGVSLSVQKIEKSPLFLNEISDSQSVLNADLVVIGGGLGGVAAAIAALRNGLKVILTEHTDWIGGQLTSQGVPPDEHPWIETHGAPSSYRELRNRIRAYYNRCYPLATEAKLNEKLNPGDGTVSRLCHEPKVALAALHEMLDQYISSSTLLLLTDHVPISADVADAVVNTIKVKCLKTGRKTVLSARYFIDATELGDLLPLTGTEYRTGTESRSETGELHAPEKADQYNHQAFTMCFAMDHVVGENHTIQKPHEYDFWKKHVPAILPSWPGPLLDFTYTHPSTLKPKLLGFDPEGGDTGASLNLWLYRRIIHKNNFNEGAYQSDITLVNWPQNDYMLGNIIDVDQQTFNKHVERAKQLSLSLLYWLQTEAPRPDGGKGWPGLRLRKDIMGTDDGLAKYPYVRESRRIKAKFTILEEHVGKEQWESKNLQQSAGHSVKFFDSVGIGYYHIDLHPSSGGMNYVDFPSIPFEIPLGALLPVRMENIFPACKNIGTTHITNGCFRLHPVEWSIGEAVGSLVAFSTLRSIKPKEVREKQDFLLSFQQFIRKQGVETSWPTT